MRELTNPDPPCHMEERHRRVVEGLLRDAREQARLRLLSGEGEERDDDDDFLEAEREGVEEDTHSDVEQPDQKKGRDKEWSQVEKKLLASGFSTAQTQQAWTALTQTPTQTLTLSKCMDWLCLHLPETGKC